MNAQVIEVRRNQAGSGEIARHLRDCDAAFVPPLATRVDIDAYAEKIVARAERFEAWADGSLAGLVAAYCNRPAGGTAFVTNVSVLPDRRGLGIASRLLRDCIAQVRERGFARIELEVALDNTAAIDLYAKHGFTVARSGEGEQILHLAL